MSSHRFPCNSRRRFTAVSHRAHCPEKRIAKHAILSHRMLKPPLYPIRTCDRGQMKLSAQRKKETGISIGAATMSPRATSNSKMHAQKPNEVIMYASILVKYLHIIIANQLFILFKSDRLPSSSYSATATARPPPPPRLSLSRTSFTRSLHTLLILIYFSQTKKKRSLRSRLVYCAFSHYVSYRRVASLESRDLQVAICVSFSARLAPIAFTF